jgi:hypothetical protein
VDADRGGRGAASQPAPAAGEDRARSRRGRSRRHRRRGAGRPLRACCSKRPASAWPSVPTV